MQAFEITKRQQEIIDCAGKILSKSGISGLTTKNLALAMRFSESALYRHFKSKGKIVEAMLAFMAHEMNERLGRAIEGQQSPEEQFISMFRSQFDFFSKNPHFVVAAFSDGLMEESKEINLAIKKIMAVKYKILMPIIKTGQTQGVFTDKVDDKELIHIIMGTFRLMMFKWRMDEFKSDIKKEGDKQIQSLLTLLIKI